MASEKDQFEPDHFESHHFAAGHWRGLGITPVPQITTDYICGTVRIYPSIDGTTKVYPSIDGAIEVSEC